jgi:RNA polymerase sigma factor (sigma-70 family)
VDAATGSPSSPPDSGPGQRLALLEDRLRLLLAHLAGRAVRARVELDDLLQEVYLRALTTPRGLPPAEENETALWRFLVRLGRHAVIDAARSIRAAKRSGRTQRLAHSEWSRTGPRASQILARTAGPVTRAIGSETSRALRERYEALSPEHRRVLGLRQFEGLSARATAARMGRSETAVHSLYRRALAAWQEGLETGPSGGDRRKRDESGPALRPEPS